MERRDGERGGGGWGWVWAWGLSVGVSLHPDSEAHWKAVYSLKKKLAVIK